MDANEANAAATVIWRHWSEGSTLEELAGAQLPNTAAEGYAVQAQLPAVANDTCVGWKIAATSTAGQQHLQVDGPIAGRLLSQRVLQSGATVPLGHNRMRVAEAEFAFVMARDLPPRSTPYSVSEVVEAVRDLHTAIELPDSRFAHFERVGAAQLAADNACTHWFVLGPRTNVAWRDIDLAQHPVQLRKNGALATQGTGADVLGDPRTALTWLANSHTDRGAGLRAGDVITTGVCGKPTPIASGDHFVADFGAIGTTEVRIS